MKHAFTYSLLRYHHDVWLGESLNIGILLHAPSIGYVGFKYRQMNGRLTDAFPDLDRAALRSDLQNMGTQVSTRFDPRRKTWLDNENTDAGLPDARAIANRLMPIDDSALQWSPQSFGVTTNPEREIENLMHRFVMRYDPASDVPRRTSDDVWKPIREQLAEQDVAQYLEPKTVGSGLRAVKFDHSYRNGIIHAVTPLSFDLTTAEGIVDKSSDWLGKLKRVSSDDFHVYFVTGAPVNPDLMDAYDVAYQILRRDAGSNVMVRDESEADEVVDTVADIIHRSERNKTGRLQPH